MMQRLTTAVMYVAQFALFAYELTARYDTTGRQIALVITNVSAVVMFVLVQRYLSRRYGITVHWIVLVIIGLSVWLDAIGNFQHFYARLWWWDRLTHALGGLAVTVAFYVISVSLWQVGRLSVSWRVLNIYALSVAQVLGAVYEVSEWIGDELFATHRIQGPFDTARDLFFNMVGGVVVVVIGSWWRVRRRAIHGPDDRQV